MEINSFCPECENGLFLSDFPKAGLIPCRACGKGREAQGQGAFGPDGSVSKCGLCGGTEFYRQKDFNRKLGIIILVVGFGLALAVSKWFYPILVAMAALDLALYFLLPEIQICYACQGIYRGVPIPDSLKTFDLALHDQYAFKHKKPQP